MENSPEDDVSELLRKLFPRAGQAFVIGVTGSPGSGKSTLVNHLARHYRDSGSKVGVVLVDPTSPFTGGAILGDRIRMQSLFTDPRVFIRSMASRGKTGGLARTVDEFLIVLGAAGYGTLIVETVGVGQDEVEIVRTAHMTLVVLVPGMGDDIQMLKAGLMEIGDILVLNKADRGEVLTTERELKGLLSMTSRKDGWEPPIVKTVATQGEGIGKLTDAIEKYRARLGEPPGVKGGELPLFRERLVEKLRDHLTRKALERIPEEELTGTQKK